MVKPKGDKQVEYLDLDLDSGKSTPPRKVSRHSAPAVLPSGVQNRLPQDHLHGHFSNDRLRDRVGPFRETGACSVSVWDPPCLFVVN